MRKLPECESAGSPTAYDSFATAYNAIWGPVSLDWLPWVGLILAPRISPDAHVLDLACGTGNLAGELARIGFRVLGLDGSRAMLRHARANACMVPLVQAEMRQFGMRAVFDAALCAFDSLNHLLDHDDLCATFRSVCACLRPGGWFLFDLNTPLGYSRHWKGQWRLKGEGCKVRARFEYDERRRLGRCVLRIWHLRQPQQSTSEVTLWQRCHTHDEVLTALISAGLVSVETFGLERNVLVSGRFDETVRVFYLARRPMPV